MTEPASVLCPKCGWTGTEDELVPVDDAHECPVCAEVIEFVE